MNVLSARMAIPTTRTGLSRTGYLFIAVLLVVVFEGAVRKWGTSAASLPLILARDLLAGYTIFHAWKSGHFRTFKNQTKVLLAWTCCVIAWGMLQIIVNDGSPLVYLIGLRFWLLYIWFGFAAASSMTEADFRAAMLTSALLLILMAPLVVLQYASPPGARINTEVDSVDDEVFIVIAGVVRTTGTFSFTAGYSTFLGFVIPIALAVVAARKRTLMHAFIAVAAFFAVVAETMVSGARSAVLFSGAMIALYLLSRLVFSKAADKGRALLTLVLAIGALAILALVFQTAIENTQQRFGEAAEAEDFWQRVLVVFAGEPTVYDQFTLIGVGFGQLSNLAGYVRTGIVGFTLAEAEAGRVLLEGGLLGGAYTALKLVVIGLGLYRSFVFAVRRGIIYPLLLWISLAIALLTWSAIGQLTANALLGFALAFGLTALRYPTLDIFPDEPLRSGGCVEISSCDCIGRSTRGRPDRRAAAHPRCASEPGTPGRTLVPRCARLRARAGFSGRIHALGPVRGTYGYTNALVSWLRQHASNYDAVIINGLWQYIGLAAWRALRDGAPGYYVFSHGMLDPWFKRRYPLKHLKKWLYWPWGEYRVLRDAKAVLFTCDEERLLARKSFWLYKCNEAISSFGTSEPPVDDQSRLSEAFLKAWPRLRGKRLALFLGRIHEKKGCDLLIEAFARSCGKSHDAHLVMAGPDQGGWAEQLGQRVCELGISDRVTWTGMLSGDLKWGAFYASEMFCLPSHQENFGVAVAEALACGRPAFISDKVNIWREIVAEGAGMVEPDTLAGTERLLARWLAATPSEIEQMRTNARRCFEHRFRIETVATNLVHIIGSSAKASTMGSGVNQTRHA